MIQKNDANPPISATATAPDLEGQDESVALPLEGGTLPTLSQAEYGHLRALAPDLRRGAWTFDDVEERLVEAMLMLWRLPDRERGWLRVGVSSIWSMYHETFGMDADELAAWRLTNADVPPPLPGLTRQEVREMEEALEWMQWVAERDRKLVGLAIGMLAKGRREVAWRDLLAPMGLRLGADGLRMRYGRAIAGIASALNVGNPQRNVSTRQM